MKIATVIPISNSIFREELTYFTARDISPGALVSVPVKGKTIPALVVQTKPVSDNKADIKKASFEIRPIKKVIAELFFAPEFIEAAKRTSQYTASNIGHVIKTFTPKLLTEGKITEVPMGELKSFGDFEEIAIQASNDERFGFYKSFIREEFAKKRSVFFTVPTLPDLERVWPWLTRGIEEYAVKLHSDLSAKNLAEAWKTALRPEHPTLVIMTASFLSLPRRDLGAIILERESSPYWKSVARPHIDARIFAKNLAETNKTRILWGDLSLRVETLHRAEHESFVTLMPQKFRSLTRASCTVADMKTNPLRPNGEYASIGVHLTNVLEEARVAGGNTVIYTHRRGLAPNTICMDCGSILSCPECRAPFILHAVKEGSFFVCHRCWKERPSATVCDTCNGWRLKTLGVGTEKVRDEIKSLFRNTQIFQIDSDSTPTHKSAREIADQFYLANGAVLVGTEMMLPYLREPVYATAIAATDSLFAIPDFRMNEKVFHNILHLRALAERHFVLQTRTPERRLYNHANQGTLIDFFRDEITLRRKLGYPPFSVLVKITREGPSEQIEKDMSELYSHLREWKPLVYPSFKRGTHGDRLHALIKIDNAEWPNRKLVSFLTSLPPQYVIQIDPDGIE